MIGTLAPGGTWQAIALLAGHALLSVRALVASGTGERGTAKRSRRCRRPLGSRATAGTELPRSQRSLGTEGVRRAWRAGNRLLPRQRLTAARTSLIRGPRAS
jgi:hypothetical protein